MTRRAPVLVACLLTMLGCACTGIPETSSPQAVKTGLDVQPGVQAVVTPPAGADPRSIVLDFLQTNAANDPHHNAARTFLTAEGSNRWSDSRVTVIDSPQVGQVGTGNTILVTGQRIGRVDASGVYTPETQGDGTGRGAFQVRSTYTMKKVKGQWRIDSLPAGLLISYAQFQQYQQPIVYFYDLSERHLVPDPRYSQLTDSLALADWLIGRLVLGPRDALQNAVTTELPAQTDPSRVLVDVSTSPVRIRMPGAQQLDAPTRNRLAAQIALTMVQVGQIAQIGSMQIVDGNRPVAVPSVGGTVFRAADFSNQLALPRVGSGLYFLNNGAVFNERGARLPGRVGNGSYQLSSVALADRGNPRNLLVAGVNGPTGDARLVVGHANSALITTKIRGKLSRPAFAPNVKEAWIGAGPVLYRSNISGRVASVPVTAASGKATGRVIAVRLSPEGSRVALVLAGPEGSQVWVGAVVRDSTGKVRVDSLTPISPQGITAIDVAWNDEKKLFATGHDAATGAPGVYEVYSDGSLWTSRGIRNLPGAPDNITVTYKNVAAVSVGSTVWKQQAGSWVSPHGDETRGTNPVYVE